MVVGEEGVLKVNYLVKSMSVHLVFLHHPTLLRGSPHPMRGD